MITFSQLNQGDLIHVLEVTGTFKKSTNYSLGSISLVSAPYEEQVPQQYPTVNQIKRRLVDITITCDGEQKKLSVEEGKSIITDGNIGLTIATDKQQIVDMVRSKYNEYKARKEAVSRYDEEMNKCEAILQRLDTKDVKDEDPRIKDLQMQVAELKDIIKQASNMVPAPMKQMLPQNMQNAMNEAN